MPITCPKCGSKSLDYDPYYKKWICAWVNCSYSVYLKPKENEKEDDIFSKILKISCVTTIISCLALYLVVLMTIINSWC